MSVLDLCRRLPKAEQHLHLEGAIRPETAFALARKNGVALPAQTPEALYRYDSLDAFLAVYSAVAAAVVDREDFARITVEMLEACAHDGARHVEFFASLHAHPTAIAEQLNGISDGIEAAQSRFGLTALVAPGINRAAGPEAAGDHLADILDAGCRHVVGIGLDYQEIGHPPEPFETVFAKARAAGLNVTAHAGETGPPTHIAGAIDALGVDRIDHGYAIVDDPDMMARCRDDAILFTCCPTTTTVTTRWRDLHDANHPIRLMREAGLCVTIHSDDPTMFSTTLAREYEIAMDALGFTAADIRKAILTGLEKSWLPPATRERLASEWAKEIDAAFG